MKKSIILLVATLATTVVNASYLYWQITKEETVNETGIWGDWARLVAHSDTESSTVEQFAQLVNGEMSAYRTFDISSLSGDTSSYSFWVELGTYSSVGTPSTFSAQVSSWSDRKTYTDLSSYIATTTLSDIPTTQIWHGGTMSVPEPTSAVLMLFGAAFLGLKRKNRSIA